MNKVQAEDLNYPVYDGTVDKNNLSFDPINILACTMGSSGERFNEIKKRLELGRSFFYSRNLKEFVKALAKRIKPIYIKEKIQIGWILTEEKRYIGPPFSKSFEDFKGMSEGYFKEYRDNWNINNERELTRFSPVKTRDIGYRNGKIKHFFIVGQNPKVFVHNKNTFAYVVENSFVFFLLSSRSRMDFIHCFLRSYNVLIRKYKSASLTGFIRKSTAPVSRIFSVSSFRVTSSEIITT